MQRIYKLSELVGKKIVEVKELQPFQEHVVFTCDDDTCLVMTIHSTYRLDKELDMQLQYEAGLISKQTYVQWQTDRYIKHQKTREEIEKREKETRFKYYQQLKEEFEGKENLNEQS